MESLSKPSQRVGDKDKWPGLESKDDAFRCAMGDRYMLNMGVLRSMGPFDVDKYDLTYFFHSVYV
jgi:hypothetical protein